MKNSSVFLLLIFFASVCWSQEPVMVKQPSLFVDFARAHQTKDSIVKYYLTSSSTQNASNDHLIVITFDLSNLQITVDTLRDPEFDYFKLGSTYEFWLISLPDGSSVMASNNFECDITFSEVIYYDNDGNVKWFIDPYEFEIYIANIQSMGLVRSDVIAIGHFSEEPWLYIDLNGEQKFFDIPPRVYYNTFKINGYWFGTNDDEVLKLNDSFEVVSSYQTDSIIFLEPVSGGRLIVGTRDHIILVDTMLNELHSSDEIKQSVSAEASAHSIWVATNDAIYQLDSSLTLINSYSAQPNETIHYVNTEGQNAYIASTYNGIVHQDFVIRKYSEDTILNTPVIDLSLASVKLPEKVIRIQNEQVPYLYQLRFDSIVFVVKNNSIDTIRSFNINYDWDIYYWCSSIHGEWIVDTLEILPYDSVVVRLDSFTTKTIGFHVYDPFCFWVDFPEMNTDVQPLNNQQCGSAEIVLGVSSSMIEKEVIDLYPNPSNERIYIDSKSLYTADEIRIYSPGGYQIHFQVNCSMPCEIPVSELLPGIYYIQLVSDSHTETKSFVKF